MDGLLRPRAIAAASHTALGALAVVVGLVAACHGGDDMGMGDPDGPRPIDARGCPSRPPPFLSTCDPLAPARQQGCNTGQKCTWIVVEDNPDVIGKIGCVPDGGGVPGDSCAHGPPGETTGFDDCRAGNICVAGVCKDVCGFGGGANEACPAGQACARYDDLWANCGDDPQYGACNESCNPVTQLRPDGSSCGAGQGCYLLTSNTTSASVCAPAGTLRHGELILTQAFANSCLPGHQPRRRQPENPLLECGALCDVEDVFVTDPADADSGARPAPKPAALVTNAAAEGGAAPFTCESKGAQPPGDPTHGESCRYWWAREPFDNSTAFSNTVGWCFEHAPARYDSDGDFAADAPFPRCAAVSSGDKALPIGNPPHDDAIYFWCKAMPALLQTSIKHVKKALADDVVPIDRLDHWR